MWWDGWVLSQFYCALREVGVRVVEVRIKTGRESQWCPRLK